MSYLHLKSRLAETPLSRATANTVVTSVKVVEIPV
jgi:hypothetical protein